MSIIPLFARRVRTWTDPDPTPPAGIPRPHTLRPKPDPEVNRVVNMAAYRAIGAAPWLTPEQRIAHLVVEVERLTQVLEAEAPSPATSTACPTT